MCSNGNGNLPGRNAFSASRSRQIESLPPENSNAGLRHSAATSRRIWMASDSSQSRWSMRDEDSSIRSRTALTMSFLRSVCPMVKRAAHTLSRPNFPTTSVRRGYPRRAGSRACRARSRSKGSRDRATRCNGTPRSLMQAQTSASLQSASGLNFGTPCTVSCSRSGSSVRVTDCARRSPVIQASLPASARASGSTLRIWQQRLRRSTLS